MTTTQQLLVHKKDYANIRIDTQPNYAKEELTPGEVLLQSKSICPNSQQYFLRISWRYYAVLGIFPC